MDHRTLFGTSGIRGDAEKLFVRQFCFDLGRTFSLFLDKHKLYGAVAVGMDPRGSSPRIKKAFEAGLLYEKRTVLDEGVAPVPSLCYILQLDDYVSGSVMITGSHIKDYLNGVKFFAFDGEILKNHEKEIEEIYFSIKGKVGYQNVKGNLQNENRAVEEYKKMLMDNAKGSYPKWRVVVDPGDGAQSDVMPVVLKSLGIETVELNCTVQGKFLARDTENEPDFEGLKNKVRETDADFGIGLDSDGDRCIFVGKGGVFIPGDYSGAIIAKYAPGDTIVTPVAASQVVDFIGKKIMRTKVGSPYVIETMKKSGAKFGFEANGGGISAEIMYTRDGGTTAIKFLNILKESGGSFEDLIATLPKFYLVKTKVDCPWKLDKMIFSEVRNHFKGEKVDETDGLKIWIDDTTWILFRSSQNAPEFRVFAESKLQEKSDKLLEEGIGMVKNVINKYA